ITRWPTSCTTPPRTCSSAPRSSGSSGRTSGTGSPRTTSASSSPPSTTSSCPWEASDERERVDRKRAAAPGHGTPGPRPGRARDDVWKSLLGYYSDFAGRPLGVDQEVFKSESDTNQRNQAIGYLMYAYEFIKTDPMRATDVYTEQCSVAVNAKDLAVMAGTLA